MAVKIGDRKVGVEGFLEVNQQYQRQLLGIVNILQYFDQVIYKAAEVVNGFLLPTHYALNCWLDSLCDGTACKLVED